MVSVLESTAVRHEAANGFKGGLPGRATGEPSSWQPEGRALLQRESQPLHTLACLYFACCLQARRRILTRLGRAVPRAERRRSPGRRPNARRPGMTAPLADAN